MLGRSVPFSRGRSERLLELGQDPATTWGEGPGNLIKEDGAWESSEPPQDIVMASIEWNGEFYRLANDIATEIGMVAEAR